MKRLRYSDEVTDCGNLAFAENLIAFQDLSQSFDATLAESCNIA